MNRPRRTNQGFTLVELAIVAAVVGVAMTMAVGSFVQTVQAQKRNAALSLANLTLREQRSQALESRIPHFVRPAPGGSGVVVGRALFNRTTGKCGATTSSTNLLLEGLKVSGSNICFTPDGTTDDVNTQDLRFDPSGGGGPPTGLARVEVFPAGTFRWTGVTLFRSSGLAMTSISFRSVANADISLAELQ